MRPKDFPWAWSECTPETCSVSSEQTRVCSFFFSWKPTVWNLFTIQHIVGHEELKRTPEFSVTVFIRFIYRFPQYTAVSDKVMCELSWHILKGCTCDYTTFSNVWHNLPNNLKDKINAMVLDTFSTRPMTTLSSMFVIMETWHHRNGYRKHQWICHWVCHCTTSLWECYNCQNYSPVDFKKSQSMHTINEYIRQSNIDMLQSGWI